MVNFAVLPNVRILDNGKTALITVKGVRIGPEGTADDHLGILLRQHPSADRIVEYRDVNGEVVWWCCMHLYGETDVVLKR